MNKSTYILVRRECSSNSLAYNQATMNITKSNHLCTEKIIKLKDNRSIMGDIKQGEYDLVS